MGVNAGAIRQNGIGRTGSLTYLPPTQSSRALPARYILYGVLVMRSASLINILTYCSSKHRCGSSAAARASNIIKYVCLCSVGRSGTRGPGGCMGGSLNGLLGGPLCGRHGLSLWVNHIGPIGPRRSDGFHARPGPEGTVREGTHQIWDTTVGL